MIALVEAAGARSLLGVPMVKENELVGAIAIYRQEVRPFTDKQIELVTNFASQAVMRLDRGRGRRQRYRHDAGAAGEAFRGIQPGRCFNRTAFRRHRPWPCHYAQARPHDGRRRDGGERAGQGLSVHRAFAGRRAILITTVGASIWGAQPRAGWLRPGYRIRSVWHRTRRIPWRWPARVRSPAHARTCR